MYVDDTIIAGPNEQDIKDCVKELGIQTHDQQHHFSLKDEGEVGDFLGIRIEKERKNRFTLTQPGLIQKVLQTTKMTECNSCETPATTTNLGLDSDEPACNEDWDYASIIGMLMYLANNTRPDIAFSVHQCARFTHSPKQSHSKAVKRILRYLHGTQTKGMSFSPSSTFKVDCYVDADFGGLFGVENDQDPICVKSHTGYLITLMDCPLIWVSKLQTQITLNTMEAEYLALSHSMRDLIAIRGLLSEIKRSTFDGELPDPSCSTHSTAFIHPSTVYEDNTSALKFASMPKLSPRTKHIAIPYHFFHIEVMKGNISVVPINMEDQLADQFTKGLPHIKFAHS